MEPSQGRSNCIHESRESVDFDLDIWEGILNGSGCNRGIDGSGPDLDCGRPCRVLLSLEGNFQAIE